jgi:hypothetical protein
MSKRYPTELLRALLAPMVREWGAAAVLECVKDLESDRASVKSEARLPRPPNKPEKHRKASAASIVAKVVLPDEHKRLVEVLAQRFDERRFLPGGGDIRNFFEMRNTPVPLARQRPDAFRDVLKLLSAMSVESLRRLVAESAHGPITQLGPLSDAMRDVRERRGEERPSTGPQLDAHSAQVSVEPSKVPT